MLIKINIRRFFFQSHNLECEYSIAAFSFVALDNLDSFIRMAWCDEEDGVNMLACNIGGQIILCNVGSLLVSGKITRFFLIDDKPYILNFVY